MHCDPEFDSASGVQIFALEEEKLRKKGYQPAAVTRAATAAAARLAGAFAKDLVAEAESQKHGHLRQEAEQHAERHWATVARLSAQPPGAAAAALSAPTLRRHPFRRERRCGWPSSRRWLRRRSLAGRRWATSCSTWPWSARPVRLPSPPPCAAVPSLRSAALQLRCERAPSHPAVAGGDLRRDAARPRLGRGVQP